MRFWRNTKNGRGFLMPTDPICKLEPNNDKYRTFCSVLEFLVYNLSDFLDNRKFREEVTFLLRNNFISWDDNFADAEDEAFAERAMTLCSYLASAYVYARQETPAQRIPEQLARPLVALSRRVGRPPILSYASYCLYNWKRLDQNKPIELGNIALLHNFCGESSGKRDEDWFILVHVDIEANAADLVQIANNYCDYPFVTIDHEYSLKKIANSLVKINLTLNRMPEQCNPDNYFRWVRPYIFSFNKVIYEGCWHNKPQDYRGETGAQSSIIPATLALLGVKHKDSMLTRHLQEMRAYMPPGHQQFLINLEEKMTNENLRTAAQQNPSLRDDYNQCLQQVLAFRNRHFEYAINYIAKKVENPEGTGGTPYITWLQQLRDETETHFLE